MKERPENIYLVIQERREWDSEAGVGIRKEEVNAVFYNEEKALKYREKHKLLRVETWPVEDS